jgi:hypothetical protein
MLTAGTAYTALSAALWRAAVLAAALLPIFPSLRRLLPSPRSKV